MAEGGFKALVFHHGKVESGSFNIEGLIILDASSWTEYCGGDIGVAWIG